MKAAIVLVCIACLSVASCNRMLQQAPALANNRTLVPTPAPAPGSSCPAKKNPGPSCVTEATAFQTSCSGYIQALLKSTGGKIVATTSDQISSLVSTLKAGGQTPSAQCCTAANGLLSDACACDTNVQAVAKAQQNLSPSDFQTVGQVFLNACSYPSCTDTCALTS